MTYTKQKRIPFVKIIGNIGYFLMIIMLSVILSGCQTSDKLSGESKSDKVNKRINKKHQKEYAKAREEFRENHYERQPERTKQEMEHNARKSEKWRKENLHDGEFLFFKNIVDWFENLFDALDQPDKGLFSDNHPKK